MKLTVNGFRSDELKIGFKDIIMLILGKTLKDGALEVRLWSNKLQRRIYGRCR